MNEKMMAMQPAKETPIGKPMRFENIFDRMETLFEDVTRRAYEIFEQNGRILGHELDDWLRAERELLHPVHIRMSETLEGFEIEAELPGFSEKDLEISVEPRRVVISGKRECKKEEKAEKKVHFEECSDQVMRVIELPAEIDTEHVTANLKHGMLELKMPKAAKARSVKIQPKAA